MHWFAILILVLVLARLVAQIWLERLNDSYVKARAQAVPDPEIVRRVVAGDRALFEVLMRRHNPRVYRTIRSILRCKVVFSWSSVRARSGSCARRSRTRSTPYATARPMNVIVPNTTT